jgi:ATP-binding cassette, subfamily B, bacterial CvaB/MchF/RaxB
VLLARALYAEPLVIFSDEGTAHLDPESEMQVSTAMAALSVTRITVAHRPGAALGATRAVLVMGGQATEIPRAAPAAEAAIE